jgi:O-antigen ligase
MKWRKPDLSPVPLVCLAAAISGMLLEPARAMPSIAMIVMSAYVLIETPAVHFRKFFRDPVLIVFTLVFFVYVASALNSTEDHAYLMERIRIKLPFLALPVAMVVLKGKITPAKFCSMLYLFLLLVTVTAVLITWDFFKNFKHVIELYSQGRVIETPFSHVRYSLMTAFGVICGFYLFSQRFFLKYQFERWLILAATIFLIFFLHLLAVRSGIAALYLCGGYLIIYSLVRIRNFKVALLLAVLVIALPVSAYYTIPSVKTKLDYMRFDLEQLFLFNNASSLSDGGRILSIQKATELFCENWLTGVGIGDLGVEMQKKLEQAPEHPRTWLLPHNQFLFVAAGTGIFGLLVFTVAVLLPLFNRHCNRQWIFVCFNIILLSSFLTEATVEEQMGTVLYLCFLLFLYIYFTSDHESMTADTRPDIAKPPA